MKSLSVVLNSISGVMVHCVLQSGFEVYFFVLLLFSFHATLSRLSLVRSVIGLCRRVKRVRIGVKLLCVSN